MTTLLVASKGTDRRWRVTVASGPHLGSYVEAQSIDAAVKDLKKLFGLVEVKLRVEGDDEED